MNTYVRDNSDFLSNPPTCKVTHTANQSLSNNNTTALIFNSDRWDTDGMHSTASNTNRITIQTAGKYRIYGHVRFTSNATGHRFLSIRLNGTSTLSNMYINANTTGDSDLQVYHEHNCSAGDYFELLARQTSGGALNVEYNSEGYTPIFGASWFSF